MTEWNIKPRMQQFLFFFFSIWLKFVQLNSSFFFWIHICLVFKILVKIPIVLCFFFLSNSVVTKILPFKMNKLKKIDSNIDIYILQYFHQLNYSYGDCIFFLSSSLVARAHIIKLWRSEVSGFEPWSLHIICNIPTNWAKLTGIGNCILLLIINDITQRLPLNFVPQSFQKKIYSTNDLCSAIVLLKSWHPFSST